MLAGWPARSVSTVEKMSLFLVCKVCWFLLYKIWLTRIFQLFKILFILKEILSFSKIWKFWAFKLKLSQLSSSFPSCKYLLKFSSFKNFWYGPLQLLSNSQLQSQLQTTVKIWKNSKILVWRTIILPKNTTARERNQNQGERKNLEQKEKTGRKGKKLGKLDKIGRMGRIEKN